MSDEQKTDLPPPYPGPPADGQTPYPPINQQTPYPPANQQAPYPPANQPAPYPVGQYNPTPYPTTTTARTTVVTTQQPVPNTVIVAGMGGCPNCRVGTLVEEFTCCGICLAIFFFPLGLICCLMMRRRVCSHCHMMY